MKYSMKKIALTALLFLHTTSASADFIGFKIGVSQWTPDLSGDFNSGNDAIDLNNDLDLGVNDPAQTSLVLILEHPIPIIPNIKYQSFDLETTGTTTLDRDIQFNGQTFSKDSQVTSTFDLSHNDIVLYYEILDNWLSLDLGIDLKRFDGQVDINDNNITDNNIIVDETVPLLYISARFELPLTGFYAGVDNSSGGNSANDSSLLVGYETSVGLGIEGGIKTFSVTLDNVNNIDANVEYKGVYLNGFFHF